ncbi:cytochrome P450 [Zopfia rhizophila CBS 207.26]|uniref:Cytochrome P450 n=1 Tax=Zopfia rhizophila CBS 207.26 TaxID=1314779 RepID=A0A6A6DYD6_9PEZI|nr:cytochrome P450 [Zopfia rhizophila CBS 207.26]
MTTLKTPNELSYPQGLAIVAALFLAYVGPRCIYLLYFHPLAKFTGPKIAAISNIWYAYHWFSGRYPWAIEKVIEKYEILMSGTKGRPTWIKTDFQDVGGKHKGIAADEDVEKHRAVRKLLAPAFNPRALKEQEPALHGHIDNFINQLEKYGSAPEGADMRHWFDWLACDIAGDMGYGHNFHNVDDRRAHLFLRTFRDIGIWGTLKQVMSKFPLLYPLVFFTLPPKLARTLPIIIKTNTEIVRNRIKNRHNMEHPDYFTLLLPDDRPVPEVEFLVAQANHLIMSSRKLKQEIRGTFASYNDINNDACQSLPWLHAVIEESLRLHTNGAFGLPRISPGDTICGHYIAKGCVAQTAAFAVTHSSKYFHRPREFCPERWLPSTHPNYDLAFAKDVKSAFKPFGMGTRGCIGQNMGYMQGRIIFAKMVWKFDWEHVNKGQVDWERDLKLYAIWEKPPVVVRYTAVNGKKPISS